MPSVVERAASGRAKCRACGQSIAKGELRFGEALPNAYGEGESLFWFHLACAACSRPESLLAASEQVTAAGAGDESLIELARSGVTQPRLSRIVKSERASSGRARCRHCRELIAQGSYRLALQMFEEGRFNPIGTIHAACGAHYFGAEPEPARLRLPCNELDESELEAVLRELREGAKRPILPGLVKASGDETETETTRKSS